MEFPNSDVKHQRKHPLNSSVVIPYSYSKTWERFFGTWRQISMADSQRQELPVAHIYYLK